MAKVRSKIKTILWDAADYLKPEAVFEEGDPALVAAALGTSLALKE